MRRIEKSEYQRSGLKGYEVKPARDDGYVLSVEEAVGAKIDVASGECDRWRHVGLK